MTAYKWLFNQPYVLLVFTAMFWGGNAVAGKLAVGHVSPFLLTNLRWIIAMAIIYPFAVPHLKKDWPQIKNRLFFLFALGAIGFTVFNNLMYTSLTYTSALNVAIIQASMPLAVFIFNFLLFGLRATGLQISGFALTLLGVILIAARGELSTVLNLDFNFGDLLMLIAISIYGIYSVFLKEKPDMHWLSFIAVLGTSAMIVSFGFSAWEAATGAMRWPDLQGWLVILYTAIFPSILAQVFWMQGLQMIGANRGGVFINIVPIFGSGLAILLLGEQFRWYHAVALVLIIGGVWLSQRTARRPAV